MSKWFQIVLGVFTSLISLLAIFLIYRYQNIWFFLTTTLVWLGILVGIYFYIKRFDKKKKRLNNLSLNIFTIIGFLGLFVLVEDVLWKVFLALFLAVVVFKLYSSNVYQESFISYIQKPYRRMIMMLWVFDIYAFVTTLFALGLFFNTIPFWFLTLLGAAFYAFVSVVIWKMYLTGNIKDYILWTLVVFFVMIEVIWVVHLLTFGHLVSGLLVTWIWYILQLLVRFHLTKQGIIWKKQKWFLIINLVLYILILFFLVRWV